MAKTIWRFWDIKNETVLKIQKKKFITVKIGNKYVAKKMSLKIEREQTTTLPIMGRWLGGYSDACSNWGLI